MNKKPSFLRASSDPLTTKTKIVRPLPFKRDKDLSAIMPLLCGHRTCSGKTPLRKLCVIMDV